MAAVQSLNKQISNYKVSSVLNRDTPSYGKQHLFDGNIETCWNSEQGESQHILVEFAAPVRIHVIRIQFQGGFAGRETQLFDSTRNAKICPLHPEDNNKLQTFVLPDAEQLVTRKRIKIHFASSSDFYGRIIIYALDFVGQVIESDAELEAAASAMPAIDAGGYGGGAEMLGSDSIVIM
ncbi:hypothetical protein BX070DRAFT_138696 [Coemansia spiralis]|nr:hypothetical protein BX070DRAFT_138696 [Coemansia spiralis]